VAERTGLTVERVLELQQSSLDPLSLDSQRGDDEDATLGDFIVDSAADAPSEVAARRMLVDLLRTTLLELPQRDREVVSMRFGLVDGQPKTLEEVGAAFGVTRERIRQIETKTLAKLRHPQRSQKLRDYLESS
jgi:RNA polymerase primary sigma factor